MRLVRLVLVITILLGLVLSVAAQAPAGGGGGQRGQRGGGAPAPGGAPATAPGGAAAAQARGGGGGGQRGGITNMMLNTTAWPDGGQIPIMYTQAGNETSPAIQWTGAPAGTASFALIFHDLDAPTADGLSDILHWLVWNIPGTATQIAQGRPDGFTLPDGAKQISVSGSRYRGPGAPAAGPLHHYALEIYALDIMLPVEPSPQAPPGTPGAVAPGPATRAAVFAAMSGHIRGKGTYFGLFHRPQ